MKLDEAIRIVDPATRQEALYIYDPEDRNAVENEACHLVVHALREKQNGGWISVKDRLPMHNCSVLICVDLGWGQIVEVGRWRSDAGNTPWRTYRGDTIVHGVTHWRSLPEPPKGE